MAILQSYYRPADLAEALRLLARTDERLVPLAGGTQLIGRLETRTLTGVDGVVDLRRLGLDRIHVERDRLVIGAMATLADLCEHAAARALASGLLVAAARNEGPVNLRSLATVGGVVATAAADSELYAALLALDAAVTLQPTIAAPRTLKLADLAAVDGLIVEIYVPLRAVHGGLARIARTPADRPIVAAAAVRWDGTERVALCGVAPKPILRGAPLNPPDDCKGSAAYRRAMASVVAERALAAAQTAISL